MQHHKKKGSNDDTINHVLQIIYVDICAAYREREMQKSGHQNQYIKGKCSKYKG